MRPAGPIGRQVKIGRGVALNQFFRHIALVSSHYGVSAVVAERGFAVGLTLTRGAGRFNRRFGQAAASAEGGRALRLRINEDHA